MTSTAIKDCGNEPILSRLALFDPVVPAIKPMRDIDERLS